MSIHLINNSRRYRLWFVLVLPIIAALSACSGGGSDDPEPTPAPGSLTMTIRAKAPQITGEIIASSSDGTEVNTSFIPEWETNSTVRVFARQGGRLYSFGQQVPALTTSDHTIGNIQFDGTDKLDASKPYEVYGMACPLRQDAGSLYYVSDLHRGGSVDSYFKVASGKSTAEVTKTIAGAVETLYIINKTDHPIVFRHKGFDVEKPWYYTHAEVNVDNGSVVNGKQESDVLSNYVVASSFNGSNAKAIHSFYVPNGTKIQDAQLIADISGQEVRSSNRISSDITLQNNHAYAIFAVWDGETLTLGDKVEEVDVFVYSDDAGSTDFTIVDNTDETMTISTTAEKLPKVGDVLASGPSEIAPYGFLCKVEEVNVQTRTTRGYGEDVVAVIRKGEAYLDDIIPDYDLDYSVPIDKLIADYIEDDEGNRIGIYSDDEFRWKVIDYKISIDKWLKELEGNKVDLIFSDFIEPQSLIVYLHFANGIPTKYGVHFNYFNHFKTDLNIHLEKASVFDVKDKTVYTLVCKPIVIDVGFPIVITPKFELKISAYIGASLDVNFTIVDFHGNIDADVYYWMLKPHFPYLNYTQKNYDLKIFPFNKYDTSVKLSGDVDFTVNPVVTFGLYGSNLASENLNAGVCYDTKLMAKLNAELGFTTISNASVPGKNIDGVFSITDNASVEVGALCEASVYLGYFNPVKWKADKVSKTYDTLDDLYWKGKCTLLYSSFKELEVTSEKTGYITVRAKKTRPMSPFLEDDCGFCFRKQDETNGAQWTLVSTTYKTEDPNYCHPKWLETKDMSCNIDVANFEPNTSYVIRPYIESHLFSMKTLILRGPEVKITVDKNGKVNSATIEDIPGVSLIRHR